MEKLCRHCGLSKPTTEFHKDRSKKDGLNAYCKPCTISRQQIFAARPPRVKAPGGFKKCQRCQEVKPLDAFANSSIAYDGKAKKCSPCACASHDKWRRANLHVVAALQKKARARDPERFKDYMRKQNYGMAPGEFAKLLELQGGKCAICKTTEPGGRGTFHVDHCHDLKIIRGLLCHHCNVLLGHAKDSVESLQAAIAYLQKERAP